MRKPAARLLAIVLAVAIVGGGAVFWHKEIRYYFYPRNFDTVVEGEIYRSGRFKAAALRRLHDKYGIKTVIDLGANPKDSPQDAAEQQMAEELGIDRYVLPLGGNGTGDPNRYVEALRIMADPARQPVLVHCSAGAQRTGGAVILYRNIEEGVPLEQAFAEAARHGHDPQRNGELFPYLNENLDAIRESYRSQVPIVQDELGNWVVRE